MLLDKEVTAIQDVTNRLIERSKMFGMGSNFKKTKVKRISRQPSRVQIVTDKNNLIYSPQYSCLANVVNELEVLRFFTFKIYNLVRYSLSISLLKIRPIRVLCVTL
jgi:hypothetical protein